MNCMPLVAYAVGFYYHTTGVIRSRLIRQWNSTILIQETNAFWSTHIFYIYYDDNITRRYDELGKAAVWDAPVMDGAVSLTSSILLYLSSIYFNRPSFYSCSQTHTVAALSPPPPFSLSTHTLSISTCTHTSPLPPYKLFLSLPSTPHANTLSHSSSL